LPATAPHSTPRRRAMRSGYAAMASQVSFTLNGETRHVNIEEAAGKTLNEYIRTCTEYTGTKLGCGQGGCGACTVAVARPSEPLRSVASCITPLASVHGAAVVTVEGLAGADGETHPISQRLAKFNGSQCGFCTPGMVMQLYSTLSAVDGGRSCSEQELEHCINGNICRCTGYRPIVECAKSFAADTTVKSQMDPSVAVGPYDAAAKDPKLTFPAEPALAGSRWLRPSSDAELLAAVAEGAVPIAGGTAAGVYPELSLASGSMEGRVLVDVMAAPGLAGVKLKGSRLRIGATVTWTGFVEALGEVMGQATVENSAVLKALQERCGTIAGGQVRNRGTIGGNVAITRNKGFISDWMTPLGALGASVEVCSPGVGGVETHELLAFLQEEKPFAGLVLAVVLPLPSADVVLRSFRVASRGRNAHALVNAAFAAAVSDGVVGDAKVVVGGVDAKPQRLSALEGALNGLKRDQLAAGMAPLLNDLCKHVRADLSPFPCGYGREQTEQVLQGFLVKFLVAAFGDAVPKTWASAQACLHDAERHTSATQTFPTPAEIGGPLHKPMTKTTAQEQTAGAAKFTDDVPQPEGTLIAAYVLCPEANVVVTDVHEGLARSMLGDAFHSLVFAEDLRCHSCDIGKTIGLAVPPKYKSDYDPTFQFLLAAGMPSQFAGQPVAVLLARGKELRRVERCAELISGAMKFEREGEVILGGMEQGYDVIEPLKHYKGTVPAAEVIAKAKEAGGKGYLTGKFTKKSQLHFYMEPQSALVIPDEGGVTAYVASQCADLVQRTISHATGLKQSKVAVKYRRVGGGFGGKAQAPNSLAAVAAQLALKTKLPVRFVLPRDTDSTLVGGRQEVDATWEVAVDPTTGKIQALAYELWVAHGCGEDMQKLTAHLLPSAMDEVYDIPSMHVTTHLIKQHLPNRTAVRAPGHFEASLLTEAVFDGVSAQLGIPSHRVRETNFYRGRNNRSGLSGGMFPPGILENYSNLALWSRLKERSGYEERWEAVRAFNKTNTWKKRGLAMTPARYSMACMPGNSARVDIFRDGSVQVAVSGSEIGQGLHTKVGQIVSTAFERELGAGPPMSCIRFLDTSTEQNPNGGMTGGSTTSEGAMFAAEEAVRQLAPKLKAAAKKARAYTAEQRSAEGMWFDVLDAAFSTKFMGVLSVPPDLSAVGMHYTRVTDFMYETYGVAASEVELDVLTGESKIRSSHIMFDSGMSYNPMVDVGQMEGAFIMGVGQCTTEGMDYDPATGKCLTANTWTYKPPLACDVPEKFDVELCDLREERLDHRIRAVVKEVVCGLLGCLGMPWKPTNTAKVYRSAKAIGEPPVLLAASVQSALHDAMVAAVGSPLPDNSLPMPTKPFALLPLLEAVRPGSSSCTGDNDSTSTATP